MKHLLITVLTMVTLAANAQQAFTPVDRKLVESQVKDSAASTFFPKLLQRFNQFDTTLSNDEYRLLYYGFAFSGKYSGYADHKKSEIFKYIREKQYMNALLLCDSVLEKIPISLVANYYRGIAMLGMNENDASALAYRDRYMGLRNAIISTGNGLTCKTAFKVLFVVDEYELIYKYFEVEKFLGQSLHTPCDKLSIVPSKLFEANAIYFDVSESMMSLMNMMKEKK